MSVISSGSTQFVFNDGVKHVVGKRLTFHEVKEIPAGYGGHIGIIPFYMINDNIYHILCDIYWKKGMANGIVIGEIGGGVKKTEKPCDALYREIREEIPMWFDILIYRLEHTALEQTTLEHTLKNAYSIEYLHAPDHALRYSITIFVDITPFANLLHAIFSPSSEIHGISITCNLLYTILSAANSSCGLSHYKAYIEYKNTFDEQEKKKYVDLQKYMRVQLYKYLSLKEFMDGQNHEETES